MMRDNALCFLHVGFEKSDTLFQALHIVHDAVSGIAAAAHPSAKRPSLVTVIEIKVAVGSLQH